MADQETWAKRVAERKESGLSSPAFCEGKDFTPGGLRHMAHRLGVGRRPGPRRLRIAKVGDPGVEIFVGLDPIDGAGASIAWRGSSLSGLAARPAAERSLSSSARGATH